MKARGVVFPAANQVEVWDIEIPEPGPDEVLVRVLYSGISIGTEGWILKNEYKGVTYPLVTGYQYGGVIESLGSAVSGLAKGDLVFGRHTKLLGDITPMSAGHVSRAVTPAKDLVKVPKGVGADEASLGVMPGVPWRGIQETGINEGDLVVVIGLGLVGQFACQLLRIKGARVIAVEPLPLRRELARRFGTEVVLDPAVDDIEARIRAEKPEGADVITDTSANAKAVNASFEWIRPRGRYCFQGYYAGLTCLDLYTPHVKQLRFFNPTNYEAPELMFKYATEGRLNIKGLITHRFSAEDAPKAYKLMIESPSEALGIVLDWTKS